MLQKLNLDIRYKDCFDLDKIIFWVKSNQTYLHHFYVGDQMAVIALCSPIPSIGIVVKMFASVDGLLDDNIANSLFKKYIEFLEKSSTCDKIIYVGKDFGSLEGAAFTKKKEGMF